MDYNHLVSVGLCVMMLILKVSRIILTRICANVKILKAYDVTHKNGTFKKT